jgi:tryptophan halogenase
MNEATSDKSPIRSVVIVGGGTAGWMTAAALSTVLKTGRCSIRLVESEDIGTVGVGEATIPAIRDFNKKVGLDEQEMMRATNATFKLGIEFVNWANVGDAYVHPFGGFGFDINGVAFHHYWVDRREQGDETPIDDYSVAIVAAKLGRFGFPQTDPRSVLSRYSYAFHFDAALYARYLRHIGEARGVVRTEGRIVDVVQRSDDGFIESVTLESGQSVEGDLFIDCSGFRALLIGKTLDTEYESWAHWLPCDRAVAIPSENPDFLQPYTRATAHSAGWQWRIPLQHRTGNGHVYSSGFISDDEAQSVAVENLERSPCGDPRLLKFIPGKRKKMWRKNCVAIGLSAGFLEPLESTSIHLIQAAIFKLIERFPDMSFSPETIADFNAQIGLNFDQIRDFIILHYKATNRDDSEFWNYCRTMPVPETLEYKMRCFRESGRAVFSDRELFRERSWLAVYIGQDVIPETTDLRIDCLPSDKIAAQLQQMRELINLAAKSLPLHTDTLSTYCSAAIQAPPAADTTGQ